jgi:hypothetical protein
VPKLYLPFFFVYLVTRFAIVFCEFSEKVPLNHATFLRYLALKVLLDEKNVNVEISMALIEIIVMSLIPNRVFSSKHNVHQN